MLLIKNNWLTAKLYLPERKITALYYAACLKTKLSYPILPDCQLAQILCLEPPGSISEESPFRFSPGKLQQINFFYLWSFNRSLEILSVKSTIIRSPSSLLLHEEFPLKVADQDQNPEPTSVPDSCKNIYHGSAILYYYPDPGPIFGSCLNLNLCGSSLDRKMR